MVLLGWLPNAPNAMIINMKHVGVHVHVFVHDHQLGNQVMMSKSPVEVDLSVFTTSSCVEMFSPVTTNQPTPMAS